MLAFMNSQAEPGAGLRSMAGSEFEREITLKEVPGEQPNLKNVVVHPAQVGAYDKPVHVVTLERAVYDRQDKGWRYQPYAMQAEVPYVSYAGRGGGASAAGSDRTIVSALEEIKSKNATVTFRYAWWEEPTWRYALWSGGALAVIGGVWPTVVSLLIGAGLAPKPKEKEYDLERFGKSEASGTAAGTPSVERKEMSDEDRSRLATQLDTLEKNIGSAAVMTDVPGVGKGQPGGAAPIRQLNGGPVEVMAAEKGDEDKEYKGEFYPVAKVAQPKVGEPVEHTH
jgi:hypothetical protein